MSLKSGTYIIKSSEGKPIGRRPDEDRSQPLKKVVLLPSNFSGDFQWTITKSVIPDTYTLSTCGAHTSAINNRLFAVLAGQGPRPTEWKIQAQPQHGKNIYTISEGYRGEGWISPDGKFEQVAVRPLTVFPSEPPRYPANELFEIIPCDD